MESPFFFTSGESNLFGTIFLPQKVTRNEKVILCHPFAEEKKCSQAILVNIARNLSELGYPVFLFDFYGCGDSDGELEDASLSLWIDNTISAVCFMNEQFENSRLILGGIRLGGFIALKTAERLNNNVKLLLIEPILKPSEYFIGLLKKKQIRELKTFGKIETNRKQLIANLENKQYIDFEGHKISPRFYHDILLNNTYKDAVLLQKKNVLIHIHYKSTGLKEFLQMKGDLKYRFIQMLPFWDKINWVNCDELYMHIEKLIVKNEPRNILN